MPELPSTPEVIIVGAGPSGLTAALQLAAYGIRFRIFDQKETFSRNSRTVGIQARNLELFEQMGLIHDILAKGRKAYGLDLHTTSRILQLDIFTAGRNGLSICVPARTKRDGEDFLPALA